MDTKRLHEIIAETTGQFRKGPEVTRDDATPQRPVNVVHVYLMPHESEAPTGDDFALVDCHFIKVGVDKAKAALIRDELVRILDKYEPRDELAGGPSYMHMGRYMEQGTAFQLFALGKVLGLWDLITPASMGFEGAEADRMAGSGFVMCTGLKAAA
jgi:hypothetical protein